MSATLLPPQVQRLIDDLAARVGTLERRIRASAITDDAFEVMFSYAGALAAGTSPPARLIRPGTLTLLAVTLGTAGSTSTVIDVLRNGAVVATVTVPSSSGAHNGLVSVDYVADDTLALEITSAGTGAADMTAEARFT